MRYLKQKINGIVGALTLALFVFVSCKKDHGDPPTLPPASTFVMDFSDFDEGKSNREVSNWAFAATNVGIWNTILAVALVVPVAGFYESFNHEPVFNTDEGKWIWTYNFRAAGVMHQASLKAKVNTDEVKWEMYISKEGAYADFLWYEGTSRTDRNSGEWTLYKSPTNQVALLGIKWNRKESDGATDIQYTIIEEGAPENGSFIKAGHVSGDLDAFYQVYLAAKSENTQIEWNRTSKNGRVRAVHHFETGEWQCWDEMLLNTDCQ